MRQIVHTFVKLIIIYSPKVNMVLRKENLQLFIVFFASIINFVEVRESSVRLFYDLSRSFDCVHPEFLLEKLIG